MTPEMIWTNIEIDHVEAICSFDISKEAILKHQHNDMNFSTVLIIIKNMLTF